MGQHHKSAPGPCVATLLWRQWTGKKAMTRNRIVRRGHAPGGRHGFVRLFGVRQAVVGAVVVSIPPLDGHFV